MTDPEPQAPAAGRTLSQQAQKCAQRADNIKRLPVFQRPGEAAAVAADAAVLLAEMAARLEAVEETANSILKRIGDTYAGE